jgi:hypothetical protein
MAAPAMPWTVDRDDERSVESITIGRFVKENDDGGKGFTKVVLRVALCVVIVLQGT